MTDKHKDAASTAAYIHGYDLGIADGRRIRDIQQNRIDELEAALEERHRQHLKLELEKRAVEDIAAQFSKDKAEYYRHILRLEAALKPFADISKQNVRVSNGDVVEIIVTLEIGRAHV